MNASPAFRAAALAALCAVPVPVLAQTVDRSRTPNTANEGIAKTLAEQIGGGRGDLFTSQSSAYIVARDPFRAIRRGRQLFQRKFALADGAGPLTGDGRGDLDVTIALGAGLTDSCAACHGRPRGAAGAGGVVVTRPDSRDAPHLFGAGLKEMLADEMTGDLRAIRAQAVADALAARREIRRELASKGVTFGAIVARADGSVDTASVRGVDGDLRVRPFFAHGGKFSLREFVVGALNDEMGLQAVDPDLARASAGGRVVTPSGLVLDGALDAIAAPPARSASEDPDGDGVANEIPASLVDFLEFYLLNYFKPATYRTTRASERGRAHMARIGCTSCHVPHLPLRLDRRVADVETAYDEDRGHYNGLFATARPLYATVDDRSGHPPVKVAQGDPFEVRDFYSDLKRHDLGPAFHERNYDGTLFPPDDTASNLNPGDRDAAGYPQHGHGSIRLPALFNEPNDPE